MTPIEIAESVKRLRRRLYQSNDSMQTINALVQLVGEMREQLNLHHMRYGSHPQYSHEQDEQSRKALTKAKPIAELAKHENNA